MELKGFITNLGKYTEGELIGEWITFPVDEEEKEEILKRIGCNCSRYEEYFFTDYENDLDISLDLGEYESIDSLNEIAEAVESWNDEEMAHAVIEAYGIDDFMNSDEDDYYLLSDVSDDYDLGYYYAVECGCLSIPDDLEPYFDYEAYGRDISFNGCFTSYGWVERC